MLRMERSLGRDAIDERLDTNSDDWTFVKTPLESLYDELGLKNPASNVRSLLYLLAGLVDIQLYAPIPSLRAETVERILFDCLWRPGEA